MTQYEKLPVSVLDSFPKPDREGIHRELLKELQEFQRKIVVLDDDPTGVQTVHDISVYTDWEPESLAAGMREENSMFFILTNSRSFSAKRTAREHQLIAERAVHAAKEAGKELLLISRGDSTLRGHYPLEPEVLKETLEAETGKKIDGQILCPYFKEGGRFTIDGVHYVKEGEWLVPAGQTEFARDETFGYTASRLSEYAEEKSSGRYRHEDCIELPISLLRGACYEEITNRLLQAKDFTPVCVDAVCESDVEVFAVCLLRAMRAGKEYIIRSAAAVPKVLGNVSDRPLLGREELTDGAGIDVGGTDVEGVNNGGTNVGGMVLIGSHVQKTTRQMEALKMTSAPVEFVEFQVESCFKEGGLEEETERSRLKAEAIMKQGRTAVVYTSRTLLKPADMSKEELLSLSVKISAAVTDVVAGLNVRPGFLIAKGGITSSDVGTRALKVRRALVQGQVSPGIPVWKTGPESKFPGLSYIIFPGNVGEKNTLKEIVELLA